MLGYIRRLTDKWVLSNPRYMRNLANLLLACGCPRSGTSILMEIIRLIYGEDMILGTKFPQEARKEHIETILRELEEEGDIANYQLRKYLVERNLAAQEAQLTEEERDFKDMNPDGFWEMAFTVKGVRYAPALRNIFDALRSGKKRFCKVVSQGLMASDTTYIDKVIYTIRHPRAVAKSQERLIRGFQYIDPNTGKSKNAFGDMVIHTPEMFIKVTTQASRFFLNNPDIPVMFYHFEDLIENPKEVIDRIVEFVGFGDPSKAYDAVKPKLNRSKHEDVESNLWEDAEFVYTAFSEAACLVNSGNREAANEIFQEIVDYIADPKREVNKDTRNWMCPRSKNVATYRICQMCQKSANSRKNMKETAEKLYRPGVKHWSQEPCLFECGMDPDREEYVTVEDSIKNNFWLEPEEEIPVWASEGYSSSDEYAKALIEKEMEEMQKEALNE